MKRLLLGTTAALALGAPAFAADLPAAMPTKAPPYVAAWNWTGFYIGANVGGGWARDTESTFTTPPSFLTAAGGAPNMNGVVGGGQIGYNWQTGQFVLGVEGDFDGSGQRGSNSATAGGVTATLTNQINWFATARARAGWAVDRWLIYVTGGAAWQNAGNNLSITVAGLTGNILGTTNTQVGWTIGGGVEGFVWGNWIGGVEYLYMDTGNFTNNTTVTAGSLLALAGLPVGTTVSDTHHVTNNVVRARLSYKF